ncbi:glycosyltransferase [Synechococcales cyanobacterium C]|uniref:Glycosyltransferase n=1 Tax=Petrachloros mirabilis ULC683 TaxID=2781853 RepID=A0A8K2A8P0_9CYAN|nr:glycosyltransferase [Petrachloros mirabilis]NCJ07300.1 glycosyltransferase [Petrachloros mirabilis ULC683]
MTEQSPKVSIGLPVYNGEKYLSQAIDSILSQTFADFELIISDNASIDCTQRICLKYANEDSRIKYHRHSKNIGGSNNHNFVFKLAKGIYFHWFSDDDLYDPSFLQKSVTILDENPDISLCFCSFKLIDEHGKCLGINENLIGQSLSPAQRLRELFTFNHLCEANYGLIRSETLRKTDLERNYSDSDRTLLCEIALYGKFHIIPEPLFSRRIHPGQSTNRYPDTNARMAWFYPELDGRIKFFPFFVHWKQFIHYLQIINRVPISNFERGRCYLYMIYWIFSYNRWFYMIKEVFSPIRKLFLRKSS